MLTLKQILDSTRKEISNTWQKTEDICNTMSEKTKHAYRNLTMKSIKAYLKKCFETEAFFFNIIWHSRKLPAFICIGVLSIITGYLPYYYLKAFQFFNASLSTGASVQTFYIAATCVLVIGQARQMLQGYQDYTLKSICASIGFQIQNQINLHLYKKRTSKSNLAQKNQTQSKTKRANDDISENKTKPANDDCLKAGDFIKEKSKRTSSILTNITKITATIRYLWPYNLIKSILVTIGVSFCIQLITNKLQQIYSDKNDKVNIKSQNYKKNLLNTIETREILKGQHNLERNEIMHLNKTAADYHQLMQEKLRLEAFIETLKKFIEKSAKIIASFVIFWALKLNLPLNDPKNIINYAIFTQLQEGISQFIKHIQALLPDNKSRSKANNAYKSLEKLLRAIHLDKNQLTKSLESIYEIPKNHGIRSQHSVVLILIMLTTIMQTAAYFALVILKVSTPKILSMTAKSTAYQLGICTTLLLCKNMKTYIWRKPTNTPRKFSTAAVLLAQTVTIALTTYTQPLLISATLPAFLSYTITKQIMWFSLQYLTSFQLSSFINHMLTPAIKSIPLQKPTPNKQPSAVNKTHPTLPKGTYKKHDKNNGELAWQLTLKDDIDIKERTSTIVLGPNAVGKSTVMNILYHHPTFTYEPNAQPHKKTNNTKNYNHLDHLGHIKKIYFPQTAQSQDLIKDEHHLHITKDGKEMPINPVQQFILKHLISGNIQDLTIDYHQLSQEKQNLLNIREKITDSLVNFYTELNKNNTDKNVIANLQQGTLNFSSSRLNGGEFTKILTAMQLVLIQYGNFDLFLLDEALNQLDEGTKDKAIDLLCQTTKMSDKTALLFVGHEPKYRDKFDHVLTLKRPDSDANTPTKFAVAQLTKASQLTAEDLIDLREKSNLGSGARTPRFGSSTLQLPT
ncbi:MAG: hypothetical protein VYC40_05630 [Pseudomonadota bacterium]|nr:hypothetical protein [Pseudomonadota bacterium]